MKEVQEVQEDLLQKVWEDSISIMSKEKVRSVLGQMGLPKSMYQRLNVEKAQKLILGMLTQLDEAALQEALTMLRE